ncbi:MAG TPA: hypothetical protein VMH41_12710 [Mycobacteriales bacterium]|nr:hypothetical protein [Mycobacteriales bacterium]
MLRTTALRMRLRPTCVAITLTTLIAATVTLAAGPASAANPDCTFTDSTHAATADSVSDPVLNVTSGDQVAVSCTGLGSGTSVATSIATAGASLVTGLSNQEAFTDISKAVIGAANSSGKFTTNYTVWSQSLSNGSACPPTQAQADAGLTCTLAVASLTGSSLGSVSLLYSGQPAPATPTLTTDRASYAPGGTVVLSGSGFFGAPVTGAPDSAAGVAAPTLELDGSVLSNAMTTSAATWPTASSDSLTAGGALGGDLSVPLSSTISTGTHTLTVVQPNATAYPGPTGSAAGTVTKSVTFTVASTLATLQCSPASGSTGTTVNLTGSSWPANANVSASFTDGSPASTGTALVDAVGDLTGSIKVSSSDKVETSNPIVVVDTADNVTVSCAFAVTRPGGVSESISVQVKPGKLSNTLLSGIPTTVTLTPITLRPHPVSGSGKVDNLIVTDARGLLPGWTLTATLAHDFVNKMPHGQRDRNVFSASALTMTPTITAVTGRQSEVVAGPTQKANDTTGQTLASAASEGGGGQFQVSAHLSLKVPGKLVSGPYKNRLIMTLA